MLLLKKKGRRRKNKKKGRIGGKDYQTLMQDPSSSSSIGENSCGLEDPNETTEVGEVQSSCKGPLDQMSCLEDFLPIKRGLSQFYNGKSQSFTRLADAVSAKDIAKTEDAHARKLKILNGHSSRSLDRHRAYPTCNLSAGLFKRGTFANRGYVAVTVAMNAELGTSGEEKRSSIEALPKLGASNRSAPEKSWSMTDLQAAGCHPPTRRGNKLRVRVQGTPRNQHTHQGDSI